MTTPSSRSTAQTRSGDFSARADRLVTLMLAVPESPSLLRSRSTSIATPGFLARAWRIAASAEAASRPFTDCSPSIISIGV